MEAKHKPHMHFHSPLGMKNHRANLNIQILFLKWCLLIKNKIALTYPLNQSVYSWKLLLSQFAPTYMLIFFKKSKAALKLLL